MFWSCKKTQLLEEIFKTSISLQKFTLAVKYGLEWSYRMLTRGFYTDSLQILSKILEICEQRDLPESVKQEFFTRICEIYFKISSELIYLKCFFEKFKLRLSEYLSINNWGSISFEYPKFCINKTNSLSAKKFFEVKYFEMSHPNYQPNDHSDAYIFRVLSITK